MGAVVWGDDLGVVLVSDALDLEVSYTREIVVLFELILVPSGKAFIVLKWEIWGIFDLSAKAVFDVFEDYPLDGSVVDLLDIVGGIGFNVHDNRSSEVVVALDEMAD